MFEIEKGIPPYTAKEGCPKYPFRSMKVGDSFLVPINGDDDPVKRRRAVRVSACRVGKDSGKRFITRQVDGGIRCWRVA